MSVDDTEHRWDHLIDLVPDEGQGSDGRGRLGREIASSGARSPAPSLHMRFGAAFDACLGALDERSQLIAATRTYAREPKRLAALGDHFGVSRERARQLEVRLRGRVDDGVGESLGDAAQWVRDSVGAAVGIEEFQGVLDALLQDVSTGWRDQAEVAVMAASGYERLDGVAGNELYRDCVEEVRRRAPEFVREAGVVDEDALRRALAPDMPRWDALVHNAGLVRIRGQVVLRDTRHTRVFLAFCRLGRPVKRQDVARGADLADNSSLSSMLSSDPHFVRFTKDKWGLAKWTDEPYEGVVAAIINRIDAGGGRARVDDLIKEIPVKFEVLPATVRNYLSTRKFDVEDGYVRVAPAPTVPSHPIENARDVLWTTKGLPVLHFTVGWHHLKGNSQKVSIAVAQYLGVDVDERRRIPFSSPTGVSAASIIWRSYDPNGPEMGRMREALDACGIQEGDKAYLVLSPNRLELCDSLTGLVDRSSGARPVVDA